MSLLLALWFACSVPETPAPPAATVVSDPLPTPTKTVGTVEYLNVDGMRTELSAKRAKPRLYNFWATWCGPCVAELPRIHEFAKTHPEIDVVLVSLDSPHQGESTVVPFLKRNELGDLRSVLLDAADSTIAMPAILLDWPDVVPVSLFIRADGTRARQHIGEIYVADLDEGLKASLR